MYHKVQSNLFAQKSALRTAMKEILKNLSEQEKQRQSNILVDYLLNKCDKFAQSKHIALYIAMKDQEIDTIPLIESILTTNEKLLMENRKHIYVPHVDMSAKLEKPEMVFYELKDLNQYRNQMNENNKFKLRQFNNIESLTKADETFFDLVVVPGLAFDLDCATNDTSRMVSRLGRGKGYYDVFLSKIPDCYTIGIGFNEQFVPFNPSLIEQNLKVPVDESKDVLLNQFSCELTIKKNI